MGNARIRVTPTGTTHPWSLVVRCASFLSLSCSNKPTEELVSRLNRAVYWHDFFSTLYLSSPEQLRQKLLVAYRIRWRSMPLGTTRAVELGPLQCRWKLWKGPTHTLLTDDETSIVYFRMTYFFSTTRWLIAHLFLYLALPFSRAGACQIVYLLKWIWSHRAADRDHLPLLLAGSNFPQKRVWRVSLGKIWEGNLPATYLSDHTSPEEVWYYRLSEKIVFPPIVKSFVEILGTTESQNWVVYLHSPLTFPTSGESLDSPLKCGPLFLRQWVNKVWPGFYFKPKVSSHTGTLKMVCFGISESFVGSLSIFIYLCCWSGSDALCWIYGQLITREGFQVGHCAIRHGFALGRQVDHNLASGWDFSFKGI